jgi:hypothetical protein
MMDDLLRLLLVTSPAWAFLLALWLWQRRGQASSSLDLLASLGACTLAFVGLLWFLRFGRIPWDSQDWRAFFTFFRTLHDSIRQGQMPYYVVDTTVDVDRYFADLQAPLGPDFWLLGFLSINAYYVVHATGVFAVGCWGLLTLRRELDLRPFTFAILIALFVFNGHLTAHLLVGHAVWIEMMLVPWVFVALVREDREPSFRRNGVTLVLTLALLVADGAWHLFVAAGLFIGVFCLTSRQRLGFGIRVLALLLPVIAYRVIPGIVTFGGGENTFRSGFPSPRVMFDALTASWPAEALRNQAVEWWEFDTYVGLPGLAIAVIGLWPLRERRYRALDSMFWPALTLFVLSCGDVYRHTLFRLPGLVSERVTTRFLILPLVVFLIRGLVRLDNVVVRRLRDRSPAGVIMLIAACLIVGELITEALMIRLPIAVPGPIPDVSGFRAPVLPEYVYSVWIGLAVSAFGLITLAAVARDWTLPFSWHRAAGSEPPPVTDRLNAVSARSALQPGPLWMAKRVAFFLLLGGAFWPVVVGVLWIATEHPSPTVYVRWRDGVNQQQRADAEQQLQLVMYDQREPGTLTYFLDDAQPSALKRIVEHPWVEDTAFISRSAFVLEQAPQATRWIGSEKRWLARADLLYLSTGAAVAGIATLLVDWFGPALAATRVPTVGSAVGLFAFTVLGTSMPWLLSLPLSINGAARPADAIVVLSNTFELPSADPDHPYPDVDAAVDLFQRGLASQIIFEASSRSDLEMLIETAAAGGAPRSAISGIVAESDVERAVAVARDALRDRNPHRILLVASPLITRRVVNRLREQMPGLTVVPIQAQQPAFYVHGGDGNLMQLGRVVSEYRALIGH